VYPMTKPFVLIANAVDVLNRRISESLTWCRTGTAQLSSAEDIVAVISAGPPDLVILGPSLDGWSSLELARQGRQVNRTIPLLLMPPESSEELAISALQAGLNEYVKYPHSAEELVRAVERCLGRPPAESPAHSHQIHLVGGERMVGDSESMRGLRIRLGNIAASDSSLLVTGETGTGKELVTEIVHRNSQRRSKPFVSINCAAIPDSLLESELFGYEKGAFTGADSTKQGKLRAAAGGTVFLDEIGDMSPYAQAKMLRVLESKQIEPLGSTRCSPVDIRIMAATNRDVEQMVREDKFRSDLFFRLNVVRVHLPPLRERKEDIPSLLHHYIRAFKLHSTHPVESIDGEALGCLLAHDWPGNVRELRNLLEAMFVEVSCREITLSHLPSHLRHYGLDLNALSCSEKEQLLRALASSNWNKSRVAARLKWSRMTVYRKMAKYSISDASNKTKGTPAAS